MNQDQKYDGKFNSIFISYNQNNNIFDIGWNFLIYQTKIRDITNID